MAVARLSVDRPVERCGKVKLCFDWECGGSGLIAKSNMDELDEVRGWWPVSHRTLPNDCAEELAMALGFPASATTTKMLLQQRQRQHLVKKWEIPSFALIQNIYLRTAFF
jgi:hypothetical protein